LHLVAAATIRAFMSPGPVRRCWAGCGWRPGARPSVPARSEAADITPELWWCIAAGGLFPPLSCASRLAKRRPWPRDPAGTVEQRGGRQHQLRRLGPDQGPRWSSSWYWSR